MLRSDGTSIETIFYQENIRVYNVSYMRDEERYGGFESKTILYLRTYGLTLVRSEI